MNRRSFLEALAGVAAGLALPEPEAPRVRAYSFLPGERRNIMPPQLLVPGEYVARVRAMHVGDQAVLVINQVDAWRNGVYHFADVNFRIDGQVLHGVKNISYRDA